VIKQFQIFFGHVGEVSVHLIEFEVLSVLLKAHQVIIELPPMPLEFFEAFLEAESLLCEGIVLLDSLDSLV
jgi:hypothetical protein